MHVVDDARTRANHMSSVLSILWMFCYATMTSHTHIRPDFTVFQPHRLRLRHRDPVEQTGMLLCTQPLWIARLYLFARSHACIHNTKKHWFSSLKCHLRTSRRATRTYFSCLVHLGGSCWLTLMFGGLRSPFRLLFQSSIRLQFSRCWVSSFSTSLCSKPQPEDATLKTWRCDFTTQKVNTNSENLWRDTR